jgi:uncharacterized membrane protein YkvA (DUF1232 family)
MNFQETLSKLKPFQLDRKELEGSIEVLKNTEAYIQLNEIQRYPQEKEFSKKSWDEEVALCMNRLPDDLKPIAKVQFEFSLERSITRVERLRRVDQYASEWLRFSSFSRGTAIDFLNEIYDNFELYVRTIRQSFKGYISDGTTNRYSWAAIVPDLVILLYRLSQSNELDPKCRIKSALCLMYIVSPLDIIPEALLHHPIAYIEDVGISSKFLFDEINGKRLEIAQLEDAWPGRPEKFEQLQEYYNSILELTGEEFLNHIYGCLMNDLDDDS